jgi:erythromycin esterase
MKLLIFFILLIHVHLYGQENLSTPIHFTQQTFSSQLSKLDPILSNKKLIGLGESTHGTHEFFLNRHLLFKHLVENHQFNIFFLEADYSVCQRVDRYIKGNEDTVELIVKNLRLWPWITYEMVDLIEWMKSYNQEHPEKMISYVGCDVQFTSSAIIELDRVIKLKNPSLMDTSYYHIFMNMSYNNKMYDDDAAQYILENKNKVKHQLNLSKTELFEYEMILKNLEQSFMRAKKSGSVTSYRDIKMGENILYHLNLDTNNKGFYWAHSGHIMNVMHTNKSKDTLYCSAGNILKSALDSNYLIVLQEFTSGKFNALRLKDPAEIQLYKRYEMEVFNLNDEPKKMIGNKLHVFENSIVYYPKQALDFNKNRYYIHSIGAIYNYSEKKNRNNYLYTALLKPEFFDGIIIYGTTSETKLIDFKNNK